MDINWKSETKYFWDIFVYLKISPIFVYTCESVVNHANVGFIIS